MTRKLTVQQEKFCQLFASDKELMGNGVQSYIEAYDIDLSEKNAYAAARVSASKNLTKANILARINEIFEDGGFNDVHVDKQLLFVISQNADFSSKVAAIKEYNKLKERVTNKVKVEVDDSLAELILKARNRAGVAKQ